MRCCVLLTQEELGFVATDALSHVASQGKTPEEAVANLKEALELFYEGQDIESMPGAGFFATTTMEVAV